MKRISINLSFVLAAILMTANACDEPHETTPQEEEAPQYTLFSDVYYEFVSDAMRSAELTSVFDSYQKIRTDRAAGLALVRKYYSERELFYDRLSTSQNWRVVLDPENGRYYNSFWHGYRCLTLEADPVYEAGREGEGGLVFRAVSSEDHSGPKEGFSAGFKGRVNDGKVEVHDLVFRFRSERDKFSLTISTPENTVLSSPVSDPALGHKFYPESGTLIVEYTPESNPAVFSYDKILPGAMSLEVTFHGNYFTIEDGRGFKQDFWSGPSIFCLDEY